MAAVERERNEYNERGLLVHEPRARDGERVDHYMARVRPDLGDRAYWYAECDGGRVEVRDHFDPSVGTFTRERWFVRWREGGKWRQMDLPAGVRPRMRNGFCHIVRE